MRFYVDGQLELDGDIGDDRVKRIAPCNKYRYELLFAGFRQMSSVVPGPSRAKL